MNGADELPISSRITVQETDGGTTIDIPPSGRGIRDLTKTIFVYNVIIFGIITFVTWDGWFVLIVSLLSSPFWAFGLYGLLSYINLRFQRIQLKISDGQFTIVRHRLFLLKSTQQFELDDVSHVRLQSAYSTNSVETMSIVLYTASQRTNFATSQTLGEKNWLVNQINEAFGIDPDGIDENKISQAMRARIDVDAQAPNELPQDTLVRVKKDTEHKFRFTLPGVPNDALLKLAGVFLFLVSLGWIGGISYWVVRNAPYEAKIEDAWLLLQCAGHILAATAVLCFALFIFIGTIRVDITPTTLTRRIQLGPIGHSKSVPLNKIQNVALAFNTSEGGSIDKRDITNVQQARVLTKVKDVPQLLLTAFHDQHIARQVVALVNYQLQRVKT